VELALTQLSHILLKSLTNGSGIYIDATAGNGYDTLFIAKMLKQNGSLFSFDISYQAVGNTKKLLEENNISINNVNIINDSHENIDKYIGQNKIKAAIFNLGYRPHSDKTVKTMPASTILALGKILYRLECGGAVIICSYTGHDGGEEDEQVFKYLCGMENKTYEISKTEMISRKHSPVLYLIIKKGNN